MTTRVIVVISLLACGYVDPSDLLADSSSYGRIIGGGGGGTPNIVDDLTLNSGRKLGKVQVVAVQRSFISVVSVPNTSGVTTTVFRASLSKELNDRFPYREKTKEEKAREAHQIPASTPIARQDEEPSRSLSPKRSPSELLAEAEGALRKDDNATVVQAFNYLLLTFPDSHEAKTVVALVRLVRQQGITPFQGTISTCKLADVLSVKKSLDSMELIAKSYHSSSVDKRQAIDTVFGPATFSDPNLSLDGLLNAMRQMEASRHKAIRAE